MAKIVFKNYTAIFFKNVCKTSMISIKKFSKDAPSSIFRQNFTPHTEEQLNLQINHELNASQAYLAMSNFFGRTEISLIGASSFFLAMSSEERDHALQLIDFQNKRGGRVRMNGILNPKDEFTSLLMATEEALLLERSNTTALMELAHIAEKDGDSVTVDYISKFLCEQVSHLFDCLRGQ